MKIALVHDHLAQDGGAEQVLRAFCEIWPEAPVYVVVHNPRRANSFFTQKDVRTSFLQKVPWGVRRYQWFFPFMPAAVENFNFSEYDVVLSSSSSFAKGVITRPTTLHITYCHTPTRFLWSDTHSYVSELSANRWAKKILPLFLSHVRLWDHIASQRADYYIANSVAVQQRITKYYHRQSTVIYPFVHVEDYVARPMSVIKNYFLAGGRVVPYKRFDLLVEAFNKLGRPLKIFGDGPALNELRRRAKPNIEFLDRVSEDQLKELYSACLAFLNPQEEDFGITMLEAMAAGRPVIALNRGGAREIVRDGQTGVLVNYQEWEEFVDVLLRFDHTKFDPLVIRRHAMKFHEQQFKTQIKEFVTAKWLEFVKNSGQVEHAAAVTE